MLPANATLRDPVNADALSGAGLAALSTSAPQAPLCPALKPEHPSQLEVCTLVLWLGCFTVAALGWTLPYQRPELSAPAPPPTRVELIQVALSHDPLPDPAPPSSHPLPTPPAPDAILPALPQPTVAVALPSPAIAFALPVVGPVRTVAADQADQHVPSTAVVSGDPAQPEVQRLVFGEGAGRQPAPEYPLVAERAGQEGVVRVRLTVAENGRVTAAEAAGPSPWPLLNESAVRTVRHRWRFASGPRRAYDVAIRFVLPK